MLFKLDQIEKQVLETANSAKIDMISYDKKSQSCKLNQGDQKQADCMKKKTKRKQKKNQCDELDIMLASCIEENKRWPN